MSQLVEALRTIGDKGSHEKLSNQNTVPEFDPASKEQTIAMWIHKVNECAVIYNWTDRQTVHFALPKLKGLAQKWYAGLSTVMFSWPEWQEKLKLAFPSDDNYGQLLTTMLTKRARFNDSLEEYFYDKIMLLNRCEISGKRAVDCLVFGIDDRSVRLGAEAARFESPDQLLPFLKSAKTSSYVDRKARTRADSKQEVVQKNTNTDRPIKCFNCLQDGHYKSQCPKPVVKCNKCMRFGHSTDACRANSSKNVDSLNKTSKPVMCVESSETKSSKYFKQAIVNKSVCKCFIDFGSTVTLIKKTFASELLEKWEGDSKLPSLKGFGDAIVKPLGKCELDIEIDATRARVECLIVPDNVMEVPLLVGQTFTEQPHVIVEKDSTSLRIGSSDDSLDGRVKLICTTDTTINGLTAVEFSTDPAFTGEVYIDGSTRYQSGREHYIVQGLFSVSEGRGVALVKGMSPSPFVLNKGSLLARCKRAEENSFNDSMFDKVMRVNIAEPPQAITSDDLCTDETLDNETVHRLVALLNKYRKAFAFNLQELGKTDIVEMSIQLKDNEPVVYRPYRLPISEREKVRGMVQELIDCDIIQPSTSPYASPIVLVKKKTGDVRLCVDYRALNRKTVKENFPLPRIDDQLDELSGYSFYTTLDLASGYYQIGVKEGDRAKTAFVTPDGQFEFKRMPFGLVNAPSTFMRMIHSVLGTANNHVGCSSALNPGGSSKVASAYMDDIIVPSKTIDEGMNKLESVLQLLEHAGLTLKLSKCCFFSRRVDYLGFELSSEGIKPGARKVQAVEEFPQPRDQHGVRQFIGLCSFFRRFVKDFAIIAKPLTSLLKRDTPWVWGESQMRAFNTLKNELMRKPILSLYDPKAITEVHTDACKIGVAGILMQRDDNGTLKPVAYFSRQTTLDEQHMTSYELETLAVVASLLRFRVYLIGITFRIFTDCNSLRATFLKRDLIPRVARWWIYMQEFDYSVEYRPGKSMAYVDALSRNPPSNSNFTESVNKVDVGGSDWLSTVQSSDSEIQRKISILSDPKSDEVADVVQNYVVRNKKLYRKTDDGERWVVPKGVRWQILKQCHDDIGHFAFDKTYAKIKESYWFSKMKRFVRKYVDSCLECTYSKESGKKRPLLHPIPKIDTPFGTIHIDHVGPFVKSSKGNTHILVIIDAYTKFIVLRPVKSTKTSIVVDRLREYFSIFGVPKRIISDRGSCFTSSKFKAYIDELGTKHILNAVATPRANGQVERYNRTLLDALTAKCLGQDERKWDLSVPDVQWGLNNTHNKGIGTTPAQALFGTSLTGTAESRIKAYLDNEHIDHGRTVDEVRETINKHITDYQEKQKVAYNKRASIPPKFNVGDLVSVKREIPSSGQSRKLVPKYQGPYRVTACLGNDRYQVEDTPLTKKCNRKYSAVVAVDKLKPWLSFSRANLDSSPSSSDEGEAME